MAVDEEAMAHRRDLEATEETSNSLLRNTRCCFPCFNSRQSSTVGLAWWERIRTAQIQPPHSSSWWAPAVSAFRRMREWSEIVAGPKWKTFIRRFNRSRSSNSNHHHQHGKYQYDPLSYSLNFDETREFDQDDDFGGLRNFSSRYASVKPAAAARGQDVAVLA
ncbi:hypothetical protein ACOSP7_024243 [Xanthoceras sorbifolium]|uniref:NHL repeat-containing protein n=1 Tax=Xanthoceras sorbifolium TaxID=99658 RepID=A0ABQ8H932_9ROSI|nr:hypothetical protein JRO89_XS13G0190600 [Xanthoceras sorbifolium]